MAIPVINSFVPVAQIPGKPITINGSGFTGATSVKFGGIEAMFFRVVSDAVIQAYPDIDGDGTITVTNPNGLALVDGFTKIVTQVRIPDLQPLGRNINGNDLIPIWDSIAGITKQMAANQLPGGGGVIGGGGDGTAGNIYTALGSPFKVRNYDSNYTYDAVNDKVIISDIRLLGKTDYIVSATDKQVEFENLVKPLTGVTAANLTTAIDGTINGRAVINITGVGQNATINVTTLNNAVTAVSVANGGLGYEVGDTFLIIDLPGVVFTVSSVGAGTGDLEFDPTNGTVTIHNYQLPDFKHITIYADGVVTDHFNIVTSQMTTILKAIGPLMVGSGIVLPWRKAANLIPDGWQECVSFRGKTVIGQDPNDAYNAVGNPNGLSQAPGSIVGSKTVTIAAKNLPPLQLPVDHSLSARGGAGGGFIGGGTVNQNETAPGAQGFARLQSVNAPMDVLNPARIVLWIEYVG